LLASRIKKSALTVVQAVLVAGHIPAGFLAIRGPAGVRRLCWI